MTYEIGDEVEFERDRGEVIVATVTSVHGRDPHRVIGIRGTGASENNLIPKRRLRMSTGSAPDAATS
jgi:hypothetical protein